MRYVCGFMFSPDLVHVALIQKLKPAWQAGFMNGIGGKIEEGEFPLDAMVREFAEETGVATVPPTWDMFCLHHFKGATVYFYKAVSSEVYTVKTMEEERVLVYAVSVLRNHPCMTNLSWLIPMALDPDVKSSEVEGT